MSDEQVAPEVDDAVDAGTLGEHETEPPFDAEQVPGGVSAAIEAVLMVIDQPVTVDELASALELEPERVLEVLTELERAYDRTERGFTLRRINEAWRIYSRSDLAPVVEKFLLDGQQAKLSQAALETLAVIAYRQPVSRARVGAVRGVNVDGVMRTLVTRGLIHELGQDPTSGAMFYGTTPLFLQRMGLGSLEELPPLAPYLPEVDVIDELMEQGQA